MQESDESTNPSFLATEDPANHHKSVLHNLIETLQKSGVERWTVIQHCLSIMMIFAIIIAINSNSWYSVDTELFGGDVGLDYGLTEFELYEYDEVGDDSVLIVTFVKYNTCKDAFDQGEVEPFQCHKMSSAGTFLLLGLLSSLMLISTLMCITLYSEIKPNNLSNVATEYPAFQWWGYAISQSIQLLMIIVYAVISFGYETDELPAEDPTYGLGFTWWIMLLLTVTYSMVLFRDNLKNLISKILER